MAKRSTRGPLRPAGRMLRRVAQRGLAKRGFGEVDVVLRWREIVGETLARQCRPSRIAFPRGERRGGVLHLLVEPAAAPEVQHLAPILIERINAFHGYRAVERVSLQQRPLPPAPVRTYRAPVGPLDPEGEAALDRRLEDIADSELREALRRLGRNVMKRRET